MRLIDADELLKYKVQGEIGNISGDFIPGYAIDNAPTISAISVVRCKDCKHYDGKWFCNICGIPSRRPYDFCSYGERKED